MNPALLVVLWLAVVPGPVPEPGEDWRAIRGFADLDACERRSETWGAPAPHFPRRSPGAHAVRGRGESERRSESMVDLSVRYECGRVRVLIERRGAEWQRGITPEHVVTVARAATKGLQPEVAIARCTTVEQAQALARMLVGVEMTHEGAAVWPDGRTGVVPAPASSPVPQAQAQPPSPVATDIAARVLLRRLLLWADQTGGWEAPVWADAQAFMDPSSQKSMEARKGEPGTVQRAHAAHHDEGVLEIDLNAPVSRAEGNPDYGAYVQAWVWMPDEEEPDHEKA